MTNGVAFKQSNYRKTKIKSHLPMDHSQGSYQPNSDGIPTDLFVSKKKKKPHKTITTSNAANLRFTDSSANLVFSVDPPPPSNTPTPFLKRLLADSSGNPLISIARNQKSTWQGFRKDGIEEKDLMFRVERTRNKLTKLEFQVFVNNGNPYKSDFKMRGSPFHRSCTIYKGDSIVAQTSLMYKLGIQNVVVPRNRFRVTIFPGYADNDFIVALIVIFFYGRKLWI
ncbi:unnamed protein product [Lactuca saligna]|uniref:Tubby C-terminal domain-containing protein n=1 Tax=Lactuca saligna TaxID=75948 RepID=A0AA35ZTY6_LACSI|nr:unnamed protein product [Lactuca saligna]